MEPEIRRLRRKVADNRVLTLTIALRVYDFSGRKEEYLPEGFELGQVPTIRETAAGGARSRQRRKLQTMLKTCADHVYGLIPDTAYDLCMPKAKRRLRLDSLRDLWRLR